MRSFDSSPLRYPPILTFGCSLVSLSHEITATFELERPHLPEYWMAYRNEGKVPTNPTNHRANPAHTDPPGSTKIEGKKRIHFGQIYSLTAAGIEVSTPSKDENWVPPTGFGFRNHRTAAPIILVGHAEHCGHTPPDSAAINPDQPLWVPGVGRLEPHPPCKRAIAVWFQSEFNAPTLRTGDQSVFWQIEWSDYGESRHLVCYYTEGGQFSHTPQPPKTNNKPHGNGVCEPPKKPVQQPPAGVDGVNLAKPPAGKPNNFSQGGFPKAEGNSFSQGGFPAPAKPEEFQNKGYNPPPPTTAAPPPQNTGYHPPATSSAFAQNGFPPHVLGAESQNSGFDPTQTKVARTVSQYEASGKNGAGVGVDEEDASAPSQAKLPPTQNGDGLWSGTGSSPHPQGHGTMKVTMMNGFY
jgi:hypothetical protein